MKFCKDCKWLRIKWGDTPICMRKAVHTNSLIDGKLKLDTDSLLLCSLERKREPLYFRLFAWLDDNCGEKGKHFEPKEEECTQKDTKDS